MKSWEWCNWVWCCALDFGIPYSILNAISTCLFFACNFFGTCRYDFYDNMGPRMRSILGYLFNPSIHGTESVYGNIVHAAFSMALKKIPHIFICNWKDIESKNRIQENSSRTEQSHCRNVHWVLLWTELRLYFLEQSWRNVHLLWTELWVQFLGTSWNISYLTVAGSNFAWGAEPLYNELLVQFPNLRTI